MYVYDDLYEISKSWDMVKRFICVESTVKTPTTLSSEKRYYISNLDSDAKTFGEIIRQHWRIENALHYVKDVAFLEDFSRIRSTQAPCVISLLRSLAINLLNINNFANKTKARKMLTWDCDMLFGLKGV